MKPFHFSLRAVRILRQRQEQLALERYAQAIQARQGALQQLSRVEEHLEAGWAEWAQRASKAPTALQLKQLQAYCGTLAQRKVECAAQVQLAQAGVKFALQNLLAARQQLEAVNHHYQNERRRYEHELQREEQKLLDDMASRRTPPAVLKRGTTESIWN